MGTQYLALLLLLLAIGDRLCLLSKKIHKRYESPRVFHMGTFERLSC